MRADCGIHALNCTTNENHSILTATRSVNKDIEVMADAMENRSGTGMETVKLDVEYCSVCNFKSHCEELSNVVQQLCPGTEVVCHTGRRGAFEVKVNDTLVHSKLSRLAFPDYKDVARNVQLASEGKPVERAKEQPITDCSIQ